MPTVQINLVLVGVESFTAEDRRRVNEAVRIMREIFLAIGVHFAVDRFKLSVAQAGPLVHIASFADARALTEKAAGPGPGIDMFVVRTMAANKVGWSPIDGPCDKKRKGMTGVVVSLMDETGAETGNTFAHEIGHYLGLHHCPDGDAACAGNFITAQSNGNTTITPAQATLMKRHCAVVS